MHFVAALCCTFSAIFVLAALEKPYSYFIAAWCICAGILIWDSIPEDNKKGE